MSNRSTSRPLPSPATPTILPILTPDDAGRALAALRAWLSAYEDREPQAGAISLAFDGFRASFGHPGCAPPGVTCDGSGLPDRDGVSELIARSTALSSEARDALAWLVDNHGGGAPAREMRGRLRRAIDLLGRAAQRGGPPEASAALGPPDHPTSGATQDAIAGTAASQALPEWVGEHFNREQYKLLKCLWGRGEVPVGDVYKAVYGTRPGKEEALEKVKNRANAKLAEFGIPFMVRIRRNEVVILRPIDDGGTIDGRTKGQ